MAALRVPLPRVPQAAPFACTRRTTTRPSINQALAVAQANTTSLAAVMWPVLLWLLVKFNRKFSEEHFKEREEAETNAEIEAKKLQDADTAAAREHESLLRDRVIAMEAALAAEADARAKLEGRITVEYAEVQAQLKLKMDRPRASPQVGFLQEGRDRKSPAPEASRRPSHQDENPHQFRLAKLRR